MNITYASCYKEFRPAKRLPRLNGDTRKRKKRLRKKLAKQDWIKYGPAIRKWADAELKRIDDSILMQIIGR